MPGMSGLDLQAALNREGAHPPIIFLTSFDDQRIRAQALAGGCEAFLGKPVDDVELIARIEAVAKATQAKAPRLRS